jgi:TATA-binding protein-associated factor
MEDNEFLQRRSARAIARLIALCVEQGRTKISDKLIRNLSAFLCVDTAETPEFHPHQTLEQSILSLKREEEKKDPKDLVTFAKIAAEAKIKRSGAQAALEELSDAFGANLLSSVPRLRDCMSAFTVKGFTDGFPEDIESDSSTFGQSIIDEFSILRTLLPRLHPTVIEQLREMYPYVVSAIECRFSVIRFAAARCFASMCKANLSSGMKYMVENILPMVADQHELRRRQGAIECIYRTLPVPYHLIDQILLQHWIPKSFPTLFSSLFQSWVE